MNFHLFDEYVELAFCYGHTSVVSISISFALMCEEVQTELGMVPISIPQRLILGNSATPRWRWLAGTLCGPHFSIDDGFPRFFNEAPQS